MSKLLSVRTETVADRVRAPLCHCGCGQAVPAGRRKFVNQAHYDRSKSLSAVEAEQLIGRFNQDVPKKQLARECGVSLTTVKRLLRRYAPQL